MRRTCVLFFMIGCVLATAAVPPTAGQPRPKEYDAVIRYRIVAGRNERIAEYQALNRYLKSIGFVVDPNLDDDPRDSNETQLVGKLPASVDRKLLFLDPAIEALLLTPAGYAFPAELTPVKVQMSMVDGLQPDQQRALVEQVRPKLIQLGFKEAVGYDHRGHTRLLGLIPAREVATLLKDLRWQPSSWLAPSEAVTLLPKPLRNVSPIRVIEVLPEPEGTTAPAGWGIVPTRVTVDPAQKLTAPLRDRAGKGDETAERLELFLTYSPGPDDQIWRGQLQRAAPGLVIEGRLGTMLTVKVSPRSLMALAQLPVVSGIREPRPAVSQWALAPIAEARPDNAEVFRALGLDALHAQGHRGRGIRAAVIDGDFHGWEHARNEKALSNVRYVDLTAERNPTLHPDAFPGHDVPMGTGTQRALALALAAPAAEITLIRIDPAAPHQLDAAVRLIRGEPFTSESMAQRNAELRADAEALRRRRAELTEERKRLLNDFRQDEETTKRREAHFQNVAKLEADEKDLEQRQQRFFDLVLAERALHGIQIVSSSLVWNSGYPLSGDSELSRLFANAPPGGFIWFQSAGNTRGQTWAGTFNDHDGNGVMEFAPPDSAMLPNRWTHELNFLAWKAHDKDNSPDLPEKTRLRLSVQWREPHDPSVDTSREDLYRRPLADLRLVVLRQRDPSGQQVGADEFDVIAQTEGLPQRINRQTTSATYEHVVEFTPELAGRYAIRLEGRIPPGIRPPGVPSLPAQLQGWELNPRVHVEAVGPAAYVADRPVFLDYATDMGSLGVPADSDGAVTVGATNMNGDLQPYTTLGPPLSRSLLRKPNVLVTDVLDLPIRSALSSYGSDIAAPFAAGVSAAMLSSGMPLSRWDCYLHQTCGQVLRLP